MHRFYAPLIESTLTLPEEESGHAVRVLRLTEGSEIEVVDGKGNLFLCRITLAHHKHCGVEIVHAEAQPNHWGHKIVLAVAPTKNLDRMEWMAEKCAEMGVDRIVPLKCRYSERKELKIERINKILVSAMKQSLKTTLPQIDEMTPIMDFIAQGFEGQKFIAYCDPSIPRLEFAQEYIPGIDTLILIGPEGDFSQEEISACIKAGFKPISLGKSRLRTETAAIAACFACHTLNIKSKNE